MPKISFAHSIMVACKGVYHALLTERNFYLQALIGLVVILAALLFEMSLSDIILLLIVCSLVLVLELINTSLERFIDIIHPQHRPAVGLVKDMMAGAVLISVILSIIIGLMIFHQPFINLFFS
ncbi:MAG TPA: diacylglycerol kinase [Candidatus Nanoarchaeia archaeon]|nr:diacylglycerol kinase [Candidatus Nanoarchaeia archaeon]